MFERIFDDAGEKRKTLSPDLNQSMEPLVLIFVVKSRYNMVHCPLPFQLGTFICIMEFSSHFKSSFG